jgi:hypothetical protein
LVKVRVESNDLKWINAILFLTRSNTFPTFFFSSPYLMKYDEDAPPCCGLVILVFCNVALFIHHMIVETTMLKNSLDYLY